jgi:hypothetical protein
LDALRDKKKKDKGERKEVWGERRLPNDAERVIKAKL